MAQLVLNLEVQLDATPDDLRAAMKVACTNLNTAQLKAVAQAIMAEVKERQSVKAPKGPLAVARVGGRPRQA